ncbi:hypothetical protein [Pseudovibrio sp. SPO723]|uniref:hypothetical protein n=1 Tax=Nesiotobacter zosterae TaxID=392721 RepID=UPI0029C59719|nr:hypothetical protein [Pseudovibrio sp. SPO723]MDX5595592.1 hypothetical protein [Pseudovibrio sp. SPO723]
MEILQLLSERGDLAHLTLFLWASSSTSLLLWALKELVSGARKLDAFLEEVAHLNKVLRDDEWP